MRTREELLNHVKSLMEEREKISKEHDEVNKWPTSDEKIKKLQELLDAIKKVEEAARDLREETRIWKERNSDPMFIKSDDIPQWVKERLKDSPKGRPL